MGSKQRFSMLEDFWSAQGFQQSPVKPAPQILVTCYMDPQNGDFVVGSQTAVIVQNDKGTLREHTTKETHVHHGTTFSSVHSIMMNKTYHQFATGHAKWPYMFVLRSLFDTVKKSDPFGKECVRTKIAGQTARAMFLDEFANLPAKPPLTKRQIKLLRKKNVCPDCKQSGMCWQSGPSEGAAQKYKCANCSVMFNMTPTGTVRI